MADGRAVLVTGGAGYIGSHAAWALLDAGRSVLVLDDLSTGRAEAVPPGAEFVRGDVGDPTLLARLFAERRFGAVMHFAGSVVVPESVADPLKYYRNNSAASRTLIEAAVAAGVPHFIFSSTAAVYGIPDRLPVAEDAPTRPANPYGRSKLMVEQMLADAAAAHGFNYAALRYFNVAGADPAGRAGQSTPGATHLVKVAVETACGRRDAIELFGQDYPTPDGTGIRDFIHVSDLVAAHLAALRQLEAAPAENLLLNCGYGRGYSVREVVAAVGRAAGRPIATKEAARRPGDVPAMVADNRRILAALDWRPAYDDLDLIVAHALAWEQRLS